MGRRAHALASGWGCNQVATARPIGGVLGVNFSVEMVERIELVSVDAIAPYERNPRTHSESQVDQIAASITRFGFTNPILVDSQSGIVAGHGRLLAAKKLSLEYVPIIRLDHLSDEERRAYIIADNQLALNAGWDEDLLASEIAALSVEGFDLDLLGFDDAELAELLDVQNDAEVTQPAAPDPDPVSRVGDVWRISSRRVYVARPSGKKIDAGAGYTFEPDPAFADALVRQFQRLTGSDAVLDGDGRRFSELEQVRSR